MASIDSDKLKKLITESVREIFIQNDFIKMVVSEAVKTAIITVLTEVNKPNTDLVERQTYSAPKPKNNINKKQDLSFMKELSSEMNGAKVPKVNHLEEDPFLSTIKGKTQSVNRSNISDIMEPTDEDPDDLLEMLKLR